MDTLASSRLDALTSPKRNHYFYGKLLDELHLTMEQQYVNGKRWTLNRLALGSGVLCGLQVTSDGTKLTVSAGVAIDGHGREIIVPQTVTIDPWQAAGTCEVTTTLDAGVTHTVYLALCFCERKTDFMPALFTDCDCEDPCAPSTIVEGYRLVVIEDTPPDVKLASDALCKALNDGGTAAVKRARICDLLTNTPTDCNGPSGEACVTLATMTLTDKGQITDFDDVSARSVVCSNELLFELLLCLKGAKGDPGDPGTGLDPNLAKITFISWPHNGTMTLTELIDVAHKSPGLRLTFSEQVVAAALPSDGHGWMTVNIEFEVPGTGWIIPWQIRPANIHFTDTGPAPITIISFVPPPVFYVLAYIVLKDLKQEKALVRIRVNCDHLHTAAGQRVDGNFVDAQLTATADGYPVISGDGVPGGLFESWFYLTPEIDPPTSIAVNAASRMSHAELRRTAYFLPTHKG
jgi:hypothetical protein